MNIEYFDNLRRNFVSNPNLSPSREIEYFKEGLSLGKQFCFVGGGVFNKEEKDRVENLENFCGVILYERPTTKDIIVYNDEEYKVRRWTKKGNIYTIYTEISKFKRGK